MEGTFRGRPDIQDRVRAVVSKFADRVEAADFKKKKRRRKIMGKIISESWVEKDDPMFTGRFHVHSVRVKDSGQRKKKLSKLNKKTKRNLDGRIR